MYICEKLNYFGVHQGLAQHCKSTMSLKTKNKLSRGRSFKIYTAVIRAPESNKTTFKNVFQYQMANFDNAKPQLLLHQPNS